MPKGFSKDDNSRPKELDGNGNSVGTGVGPVLGGIDNATGQQQTDGDTELVTRHDSTSNLAGRDLGHVQDDDGRDEPDTDALACLIKQLSTYRRLTRNRRSDAQQPAKRDQSLKQSAEYTR